MKKQVVLFLCTANSARSQMAEALLRHRAGDRFEAHSAGLTPSVVHPMTIRVLQEIGLDTNRLRSKGSEEFLGKMRLHYAIIVCDKAAQSCPRLHPFALHTLHWPFDDPAAVQGPEEERLAKFREVRDKIDEQIRSWLTQVPVPT